MSLTKRSNLWVANREYPSTKVDLLSDFAEGLREEPVKTKRGVMGGAKTIFNEGRRLREINERQTIYVDMSSTRPLSGKGVTLKQFAKILGTIESGEADSPALRYYTARVIALSNVIRLDDGAFFINRLNDVYRYITDNNGVIDIVYRPINAEALYQADECDLVPRRFFRIMRHVIALEVKFP